MDLSQIIQYASENSGNNRPETIRDHLIASGADLSAIETEARETFTATHNDGTYADEDVDALETLADIVTAAADAKQQREKQDAKVAALADRVQQASTNDKNHTEQENDSEQAEDRVQGMESETSSEESREQEEGSSGRRAGGHGRSGARHEEVTDESDDGGATAKKRMSLSASDLNAQRSQNLPQGRAKRSYSITAGADVPDVPAGKNLSLTEMGETARARMRAMPVGQETNGEMRRSIATINRNFDSSLIVDGDNPMRDAEVIDRVADERNLPGGSLVAAAQQQHDALVASGQAWATPPGDVWCSPSETDYTLCAPLATRTGLIDLPSLQVRRGGIRYPVWKQFPEQRRPPEHGPGDREESNDQAQGWYPTNNPSERYPYDAQHTAEGPRHDWHGYAHMNRNNVGAKPDLENPDYFIENPKKAIFGPCVEFAEQRMHQAYLWIEEDILRNHTYPELAERFMSDALLNHAHFMSETYIKWIVAHSDRLDPFWAGTSGWWGPGDPPQNGVVPPGPQSYPMQVASNHYYPGSALDYGSFGHFGMGSAAEAVLERIGYLATWMRNTYRMGHKTSIEGFAPWWFREFLKLDIQRKLNRPHKLPVQDSEVDAYLRQWGVKLQWLYNYQDMPSTEYNPPYDDVRSQHIMPRGGWPNAVDLVLYPAGAWVLAEDEVIRLDATYDSNRLRNNRMTSLFLEDAWMLLNRCSRSFVVQLRGLCANGATGEPWQACSPDPLPARREQVNIGGSSNSSGVEKQANPPKQSGGKKKTGGE